MSSVRNIFRSLNIIGKNFCTNTKNNIIKKVTSEISNMEPTKILESNKTEVVYPQPVEASSELLKSFDKVVDKKKLEEYLDRLEESHRTISPY